MILSLHLKPRYTFRKVNDDKEQPITLKMALTVRFPAAKIAPMTSTTADSQTLLGIRGANSSIKLIISICGKRIMTSYIVLAAFLLLQMDKVELSPLHSISLWLP